MILIASPRRLAPTVAAAPTVELRRLPFPVPWTLAAATSALSDRAFGSTTWGVA
jgi:hypothetical protein